MGRNNVENASLAINYHLIMWYIAITKWYIAILRVDAYIYMNVYIYIYIYRRLKPSSARTRTLLLSLCLTVLSHQQAQYWQQRQASSTFYGIPLVVRTFWVDDVIQNCLLGLAKWKNGSSELDMWPWLCIKRGAKEIQIKKRAKNWWFERLARLICWLLVNKSLHHSILFFVIDKWPFSKGQVPLTSCCHSITL